MFRELGRKLFLALVLGDVADEQARVGLGERHPDPAPFPEFTIVQLDGQNNGAMGKRKNNFYYTTPFFSCFIN